MEAQIVGVTCLKLLSQSVVNLGYTLKYCFYSQHLKKIYNLFIYSSIYLFICLLKSHKCSEVSRNT